MTADLTETVRGASLRLAIARVKLAEMQARYDRREITAAELLQAEQEFKALREPMKSLAVEAYTQGV